MTIRYNEYVKRPKEELEYTPEQIKELQKCKNDIFNFLKYVKVIHLDKGEIEFKPYDYQRKLLEMFQKERKVVCLAARQSGKSSTVIVYALWYAIFHPDKIIGIVSNKERSAKMILYRLKRSYESLPPFLKPGVTEYSKTFTSFDNGSRVLISATSPDAFRGESINLLVCDEFGFVPKNQAEAFWAANYPTISSSKESRVIIVSTPNGMFNLFHKLYTLAEKNMGGFKHVKIGWEQVPGRDAAWAKRERETLGDRKFDQEYNIKFLGSTNTVIKTEVLETIINNSKEIEIEEFGGALKIYELPSDSFSYTVGADTAKGTGENNSCIQVLKILSMKPVKLEQVATFFDNKTDVYKFADIINRLSNYYKRSHIMVENNAEGAAVVNKLWWDIENPKLVNSSFKSKDIGIRATKTTKPRAVLLMKKLIEDGNLTLWDRETLDELTSFIEDNGKFYGKDTPDDAVSALYWACYFFLMDQTDEEVSVEKEEEEEGWGILSDSVGEQENWNWLTNTSFLD